MKNKKMELLKNAKKVKFVFDKMDEETQEAVKSLITHLKTAKYTDEEVAEIGHS